MFDQVEITIKGGEGGDGAISFRREKYVPLGGPAGGDGGNGGDVIIMADPAVSNLSRFRRNRAYRAADGGKGGGSRKHGKRGADLVIPVPPGTVVTDGASGDILADLDEPGKRVVAARGGKGGFGNCHYASPSNQAPKIAQKGAPGEVRPVLLEMRLIADVGIIGLPNVGKSSLLAAASRAEPKIADYPFTTLEPVLGVVEEDGRSFVMAEIPGLVRDAHLGRGLGHDFLRHILRTRVLIHLVDGNSADPLEDVQQVNNELYQYDPALGKKPQIMAVNKNDLPQVRSRQEEIRAAFQKVGLKAIFISAATGEGIAPLMKETLSVLDLAKETGVKETPKKVFRPQPRRPAVVVRKDGNVWIVDAPELERIVARIDVTMPEPRWQLERELRRLGVNQALVRAGARPGDKVRCGSLKWEW